MRTKMITVGVGTLILSLGSLVANAGQWSAKPACDQQHERDSSVCRSIMPRLEMCWSSAAERLAYCNRTGETGKPSLLTGK